jgi:hypothetical protein
MTIVVVVLTIQDPMTIVVVVLTIQDPMTTAPLAVHNQIILAKEE